MKRYRCHKVVDAAPILAVARAERVGDEDVIQTDGVNVVVPHDFFARGVPAPGDYLVRYDNSYLSWSPKAAFEAGYTAEPDTAKVYRQNGDIEHHQV